MSCSFFRTAPLSSSLLRLPLHLRILPFRRGSLSTATKHWLQVHSLEPQLSHLRRASTPRTIASLPLPLLSHPLPSPPVPNRSSPRRSVDERRTSPENELSPRFPKYPSKLQLPNRVWNQPRCSGKLQGTAISFDRTTLRNFNKFESQQDWNPSRGQDIDSVSSSLSDLQMYEDN